MLFVHLCSGVIRKECEYMRTWQGYKCTGLDYRMLVIESLDADTETRRLSPVAVLGDGFVDLINGRRFSLEIMNRMMGLCPKIVSLCLGPQDHGWCAGYTCQKRVSLFHSIIATNHSFDIFFSSISPQKLRLMMLNADPAEVGIQTKECNFALNFTRKRSEVIFLICLCIFFSAEHLGVCILLQTSAFRHLH